MLKIWYNASNTIFLRWYNYEKTKNYRKSSCWNNSIWLLECLYFFKQQLMSRLKDYASAWEMKYNPENYKVGADWKEAIKNNNVEKIVNLNEKLKLGEGLKGCTSAYWVIYTDTIDLSDFTSEKKYLKKIGDSLVLNLGGTKSIERDELSDMLENGKKITFICLYTAVDTDEGVQNCVYPIIYDAGDGAYLYKPYFKTMGTSIIDKNKMAQSTTESDAPVSVRVM